MLCPRCHTPGPDGSRFCPGCGAAFEPSAAVGLAFGEEATHLPPSTGAPGSSPSSSSGWLSSSASIDHGQFAPGVLLDSRYRIVGLIGRGGMGEVYRADDLRLGQPVAVKLLPAALAHDVARLAQFHTEVRTARQVSHPNVCRVYDIGEVEGRLYLTMEYVDGEDLSSLLRRIGRLPEDKAVDLARQVCAGLAAAHERGVLHRDLKPANVMIDGTGKARIMDFSLATLGEATDVRAGTPAYMAPEQLLGREVTARSDIYALGLVLYELMTGRRAFDAKTLADLVAQHESGSITPPAEIVKTLDPAIERAILRCLETDPARRPASALAVAAALPGGDPLAAALAAGETPSPEMVVAAGSDAPTVTPLAGIAWVALTVVFVLAAAFFGDRVLLFARTVLDKPAAVLLDRAQAVRGALGYGAPVHDEAAGFVVDGDYLAWADRHGAGTRRWAELAGGEPAPIRFWYRSSVRPILPVNSLSAPALDDPPLDDTGMTTIQLDLSGRLLAFEARPPQVDRDAAPAPRLDWTALFTAAGLDRSRFSEAIPAWTPRTFADDRRAWTGRLPGSPVDVRIEAASYRGRPVSFEILGPWTAAGRDTGKPGLSASGNTTAFGIVLVLVLLTVSAVLARRNLRSGRADRRGAFRLASFVVALRMGAWLLSPHVKSLPNEQMRLFSGLGLALFVAGAMYLVYLALEPHVRRVWPTMLLGWSRALSGRHRDPVLGWDALVGGAAGAAMAAMTLASPLLLGLAGQPEPIPLVSQVALLTGASGYARTILLTVDNALQQGLIQVLMFVVLRDLVSRGLHLAGVTTEKFATAITIVLVTGLWLLASNDRWLSFGLLFDAMSMLLPIWVILRAGLFAAVVMFFVDITLERIPLTLDPGRLYTPVAWTTMAGIIALSVLALWMARAGEPTVSRTARR